MGYYSDVSISIEKSHLNLAETVLNMPARLPQLLLNLLQGEGNEYSDLSINDSTGIYTFWFTGIKWYTDYPDITEINVFLDNLPYEAYHFLRVGAELDDTEDAGGLDDDRWLACSIEGG